MIRQNKQSDTAFQAAIAQTSVIKSLNFSKRLKMAFDLSDTIRDISYRGIELRHPQYNKDEIQLARFKLILTHEQFKQTFTSNSVKP